MQTKTCRSKGDKYKYLITLSGIEEQKQNKKKTLKHLRKIHQSSSQASHRAPLTFQLVTASGCIQYFQWGKGYSGGGVPVFANQDIVVPFDAPSLLFSSALAWALHSLCTFGNMCSAMEQLQPLWPQYSLAVSLRFPPSISVVSLYPCSLLLFQEFPCFHKNIFAEATSNSVMGSSLPYDGWRAIWKWLCPVQDDHWSSSTEATPAVTHPRNLATPAQVLSTLHFQTENPYPLVTFWELNRFIRNLKFYILSSALIILFSLPHSF